MLLGIQVQKAMLRYEVKEALEKMQLVKVVLPKQKVHWIEDGKELIVNGILFDVHRMELLANDSLAIYGLSDEKEQQLNAQVDLMLKKNKAVNTRLVKMIVLEPHELISYTLNITLNAQRVANYKPAFYVFFTKPTVEIITPPPQV